MAGKIAVITGASQGIGLAIAEALAKEGCAVAIGARSQKKLRVAEKKLLSRGATVLAQVCDVRDEQSVADFFNAVRRKFRRIDVLVNNAGISHAMADTDKLPPANWREVIETNLTGMFLCTRAALPMMSRGGTIINNLSVAARMVFGGLSAYCASKHGALGFTDTLREEMRPRGIRVLALLPGATDTEIWNQFMPEAPRARMIAAEAVAQAVVGAVLMPTETAIEQINLGPVGGTL